MDASKRPDRKGEKAGARGSQSSKSQSKADAVLPSVDLPSVASPGLAPPDPSWIVAISKAPDATQTQSDGSTDGSQRPLAAAITQLVDNARRRSQTIGEGAAAAATPLPAPAPKSKSLPPIAAMIALAMCIGAGAGSLATIGFELATSSQGEDNLAATRALQASIAQINGDLAKLKSGVAASDADLGSELGRLSARVDQAEKAQAEPAAKIAKLSETVNRLERRGQQTAAASPVLVPPVTTVPPVETNLTDITGAIPLPPRAPAAPRKDVSRIPVVRGWVLRNIYDGTALIQGPRGLVEVEIGDPLPGGGRVESIQRQSGRWVVVTSRGLIIAR